MEKERDYGGGDTDRRDEEQQYSGRKVAQIVIDALGV